MENNHIKAHIVVIMLTASLNPDDKERALKDREIATFFLHKTLRPETVLELFEKYFEKTKEIFWKSVLNCYDYSEPASAGLC